MNFLGDLGTRRQNSATLTKLFQWSWLVFLRAYDSQGSLIGMWSMNRHNSFIIGRFLQRSPQVGNEPRTFPPCVEFFHVCRCPYMLKAGFSTGLHYLAPSYAPLVSLSSQGYSALSVAELTNSSKCMDSKQLRVWGQYSLLGLVFDRKNMLCAINPANGKYLTAATIYRGKISSRETESAINDITTKQSQSFVEYVLFRDIDWQVFILTIIVVKVHPR